MNELKNNIKLLNRLKIARKEKKWTQTDLAKKVNVARNTISSIETGQYCPTAKLAKKLCIVLNKKFDWLFYFQEEGEI